MKRTDFSICLLAAGVFAAACGGDANGQVRTTNQDGGSGTGGTASSSGGTSSNTGGSSAASNGGATMGASGAGSGGAAQGVNSGLPAGTPGNQLSSGDIDQLCAALTGYLQSKISDDALIASGCVLLAATSAGGATPTVAQCQTSAAECRSLLSGGMSTVTCTVDSAKLATCPATVAEIEACATASVDQAAQTLPKLTCDIFALSQAELNARLADAQSVPAACGPLEQKCPGLIKQPGT